MRCMIRCTWRDCKLPKVITLLCFPLAACEGAKLPSTPREKRTVIVCITKEAEKKIEHEKTKTDDLQVY